MKKRRPIPSSYVIAKLEEAIAAVNKEVEVYEKDNHLMTVGLLQIRDTLSGGLEHFKKFRSNIYIEIYMNDFKGLGRMIVDSWPLVYPLGDVVLEATHAYIAYFDYLRSQENESK